MLNQANFLNYLHQFGTGIPVLLLLSGSGQQIINQSGVEIHQVAIWNKEWAKRAFVCTQSGYLLNSQPFTGGLIQKYPFI